MDRCVRRWEHGLEIRRLACGRVVGQLVTDEDPRGSGGDASIFGRRQPGEDLDQVSEPELGGSATPAGELGQADRARGRTLVLGHGAEHRLDSPAMAKAVTISGEATKAWVFGLPSLREVKLRLKEVMIEATPASTAAL